MVIRDHLGHLCVARSAPFKNVFSPSEVELIAIKEVTRCYNNGYNVGEVVTDSSTAVSLINSASDYPGKEYFIVEDIKNLLRGCPILSCTFNHREANKAAHTVAKFAVSAMASATWSYYGPSWLMPVLYSDAST